MRSGLVTYSIAITLLFISGLGWEGYRSWRVHPAPKPPSPDVVLIPVNRDDRRGVALMDTKANQMIRGEWYVNRQDKPDVIAFFFEGKDVLEMHLVGGESPARMVHFYDNQGRNKTTWIDHVGQGQFTERLTYEEGVSHEEVWYHGRWSATENRNGVRGLVEAGRWVPLVFRNGAWVAPSP
jgi:hypothetical protein